MKPYNPLALPLAIFRCDHCRGTGTWEEDVSSRHHGHATAERRCSECDGEGQVVRKVYGDESPEDIIEYV
jgi:DnaJ-class molecular chaperone